MHSVVISEIHDFNKTISYLIDLLGKNITWNKQIMKNIFFILLLVTCQAFSQQGKLDSFFAAQKDPIAIGFSGVVLIAENGKPVYHKAFGYREFENYIPLQTSDIFELASVSKQFTAIIIMMLKEKGLLNYDDQVEKYLTIPL